MTHSETTSKGPVQDRIAWAEQCFQRFGRQLLSDFEIQGLLKRFRQAAALSHTVMEEIGLTEICRICDTREGGSCCGAGLEDKYSGALLLINLLLDVNLPKTRHEPEGCFFLGPSGCTLTARHVICVNFLCHKITSAAVSPHKIARMRQAEGEELNTLFVLNETVKKKLNSLQS